MSFRAADPLLKWRGEFPILRSSTYLISNSLGAMPRQVNADLNEYARMWATRGVRAWNDAWWNMQADAGNVIAPLIGAGRGEISMHPNVSLIQSILISSFPYAGKRRDIVFSDLEFPSVIYAYRKFAPDRGARVRMMASGGSAERAQQKVYQSISERTRLVPISHVFFRNGEIQDVKEIARKARRWGATVILDAYHSVGVLPVDVGELGVDILAGGVLKWLCGGPGGAFLWVNPRLRKRIKPKITGWVAHRTPFSFETGMRYRDDVMKFLNGTPPVPVFYTMRAGPRIIAGAGIKAIRKKSMRQTALIRDAAREQGIRVMSPDEAARAGGAVTISLPYAYRVAQELLRRNIVVDFREGSGIRIAPHFYNSDREVLDAMEEIADIVKTGAWRKHHSRRSHVT